MPWEGVDFGARAGGRWDAPTPQGLLRGSLGRMLFVNSQARPAQGK